MAANRGISLVELLGAVLVLGLIVTVVTRVYGSGADASEQASLTRMRYLHRAATMYSEEWDGELPSQRFVHKTWLGYTREYFMSPCASKPKKVVRKSGVSYIYTWSLSGKGFLESIGDKAPLFIDLDCNSTHAPGSLETPRIGLAVLIDGTTVRKEKPGDPRRLSWWLESR